MWKLRPRVVNSFPQSCQEAEFEFEPMESGSGAYILSYSMDAEVFCLGKETKQENQSGAKHFYTHGHSLNPRAHRNILFYS